MSLIGESESLGPGSVVVPRKAFIPPSKTNTKDPSPSEQVAALSVHIKKLEDALALVDREIFEAEEAYLFDTPNGNIIKGWDGFLDTKASTVKKKIEEKDRKFSHSCWTQFNGYLERLGRMQAEEPPAPVVQQSQKSMKNIKRKFQEIKQENADPSPQAGSSARKRNRPGKKELPRTPTSGGDTYDDVI